MNICFASSTNYLQSLLSKAFIYESEPSKKIDILIIEDRTKSSEYYTRNISACIFQGEDFDLISNFTNLESAVSCGMSLVDTVTFTSIRENSAVISVRRTIVVNDITLFPCELPCSFDNNIGLFQNIVLSLFLKFIYKNGE